MGTCEKDRDLRSVSLCISINVSKTEHDSICEMFFSDRFFFCVSTMVIVKMGYCPAGIEKQYSVI